MEHYKLFVWLFLQTVMLLVPLCHAEDSICPFCCPEDLERGYEFIQSVDCSQSKSPIVTYRKNSTSTLIDFRRGYYQCTNSSPIQLIGEDGSTVLKKKEIMVNEELSEGTTCSFHGCYFDTNTQLLFIQPVSCTIDINECEVNPPNCSENSHCVNTIGNYTCDCDSGYGRDGFNYCQDIDECNDTRFDNCNENAMCNNAIGSYICQCNEGYEGNGFNCSDIDECDVNNTCNENAMCNNTIGSYTCQCNEGYEGNGFNCSDIDECAFDLNNTCHENATCIDAIANYTCQCNEGYEGNGFNCSDECDLNNTCNENAKCMGAIGNYTCQCNEGYDGNGFNCSDIDECDVNNTCHENATCIDAIANYTCQCNEGYEGNGFNCSDECDLNNTCHENAKCMGAIGNYTCQCNEGYDGNGFNCSDINAIPWPAIITLVFAVLVVATTALIIICCVSNKLQDRRRKRCDKLPFGKGFWGITDLNFNPIEMDRVSISTELSELDKLDWNAPATPDLYQKETSVVYLRTYTSIGTLDSNPSEPEVSSIQSDSFESRCSKAKDDTKTDTHTRDLGSETVPTAENFSDHDTTECSRFQQIPNNASGVSHSTDGYVIPDEVQTTHSLSTYNDSAFTFQDERLISDNNNLRDSEPDIQSYHSRESPSLSFASLDEMMYPGPEWPSIAPKSPSSNTADNILCTMNLDDDDDDDGEYEPVFFDGIEGVSSSVITHSGRHSSPHLQTVSAIEGQENYLGVASDVSHDGYISMQNSPLPPIAELSV